LLLCNEFGFSALRSTLLTFRDQHSSFDEEVRKGVSELTEVSLRQEQALCLLQGEVVNLREAEALSLLSRDNRSLAERHKQEIGSLRKEQRALRDQLSRVIQENGFLSSQLEALAQSSEPRKAA
jgi:predicted  nucleic acid-binding Zn-ribbon protein